MAWKCQRVKAGVKCGHVNPNRLRKCERCLKLRRPRKQPAHRAVLATLSYEDFAEINGGYHCGICGRSAAAARRLDRDHDHRTGLPRGLLCCVLQPSASDVGHGRVAACSSELP